MHDNYAYIGLFAGVGILFAIITLGISWALRPTYRPGSTAKAEPYECGEVPFGNAWKQFRVGYYIYALIYVVFAVEVIFIFPWAKEFLALKKSNLGVFAFAEMMIFVGILAFGLVYAWRKGVLQWE